MVQKGGGKLGETTELVVTVLMGDIRGYTTIAEASTYAFWGLAVSGSYVIIGDRTREHPRLRFFDRRSGAEAGSVDVHDAPPAALLTVD